LRWQDFTTLTRQSKLTTPTDQGNVLYQTAWELFEKTPNKGQAIRLIGVGVSGLQTATLQLELWHENTQKERKSDCSGHPPGKIWQKIVIRGYEKGYEQD